MLGGATHAAALLAREGRLADSSFALAAGPLWSTDPDSQGDRRIQDRWKAEALADVLRPVGLVAWAPGANDWAFGREALGQLAARSGSKLLAANWTEGPGNANPLPLYRSLVIERAGLKIGLVGASEPFSSDGFPKELSPEDTQASVARALAELPASVELRILVVAMDRGKALRLVESLPGVHLMVIGSARELGMSDRQASPPALVGNTLVIEGPNHLQGVGVVDFFAGDSGNRNFVFFEGTNRGASEERAALERRIGDLQKRLAEWDRDPSVSPQDRAHRRQDLKRLEERLLVLGAPASPRGANYFRYSLMEISEASGTAPEAAVRLQEFYRKVNDYNKEAFKDSVPEPAAPGASHYVGVKTCATCHPAAEEFWSKTRHGHAYASLVKGNTEFNLDCVGCHVTGYEKPGGSTVTHVTGLSDVQCEVCHGAGSEHSSNPGTPGLILRTPPRGLCAESCHRPPHVADDWNVEAALPKIIGPGHGEAEAD